MTSPLTRFTGTTAVLPPQYLGSTGYYSIMSAYKEVIIDTDMRYDKRFKSAHRTTIVDTRGNLTLTVPVSKPHGVPQARWSDVGVSTHGEWWNVHLTALESAYGRTPFFEYYIDRFLPWFGHRDGIHQESLTDLDNSLDLVIREILGIETEITYHIGDKTADGPLRDYRMYDFHRLPEVEYYQIRKDSLGFRGNMSIVDLIFNMGPESPLILKKMLDLQHVEHL